MRKWIIALGLAIIAFACGQNTESNPDKIATDAPKHKVINGVERSELALTMRLMYDQLILTRDSIKEGHTVSRKLLDRFKTIHSDIPTEADKIDETYHAMADMFLASYEQFEVDTTNQIEVYNNMITNCIACHQNKCPGPVKAINKLKINL